MNVLMSYKSRLWSECLITHFTGIEALTTMYMFVLPDYPYVSMPNYTRHKYKSAHHDVRDYELSDCSVA
jgi:hypothetical protein